MKYPTYCPKCDTEHWKREGGFYGNCDRCYQNRKTDSIPTHFWNKERNKK